MTDGEDTSFAEFEQEQNEPPVDPNAPPAPEDDGNTSPPDPDAPPAEAPKPKQTAQERIDELTAKRRDAEREAKYFRDLYEGKAKLNCHDAAPPAAEAPKPPNPDDYDLGKSDERYIEAVIDFRVEQGLKKGLDDVRGTVAQDLHIQAAERAWEAKQAEARSEFADYDDKVVAGAHNWRRRNQRGFDL